MLAQDGVPAARKRSNAATVTLNWTPNWNSFIEIIKNRYMLARIPVNTPVASATFVDSEPVTCASYGQESCIWRDGHLCINSYSDNPIDPSTLNTCGADFYVIRIVGENGRMTYAGPIWVEVVP